MVELTLPKNSRIGKGVRHRAPSGAGRLKLFRIYRYDPEGTENPRWDEYEVKVDECGPMVLDVLIHIKNTMDATLAFRRSCREGVCGSCAMNIGGRNTLACTHGWEEVPGEAVQIAPLPSQPVVKDLIPDLTLFYAQYASIEPWLHTESPAPQKRVAAVAGGPREARRPLRVHPLRLLLDLLPELLVERGAVPGSRDAAAVLPLDRRFAATRPPASGSTTSRTRSSSTAATPS